MKDRLQVESKINKDFIPSSNTRAVPVKSYITYIITSIILFNQLGYLLLILIVILIQFQWIVEAATRVDLSKKMFLEMSQNSWGRQLYFKKDTVTATLF